MGQVAAVRLFVERALAVNPRFRLTAENAGAVAEVCIRLEGVPLALELAAARVRVLTIEQIATRLADTLAVLAGGSRAALSRQQSVRGAGLELRSAQPAGTAAVPAVGGLSRRV